MAELSRWPVFRVEVSGPSMAPTLLHGDALVVRKGVTRVEPGAVVLARFRTRPDLLVIKRAVKPVAGGWWVAGDNSLGSNGSETYGVADVEAVALARYWPRPTRL